MVRRVLLPWNAVTLPEIMAGAVQESKRGVPAPFHAGRAAGQQLGYSAAGTLMREVPKFYMSFRDATPKRQHQSRSD